MSGVATYTKSGTKATTAATLDKKVFACDVGNHELLKLAYLSHLNNKRPNLAKTKRRGEVRGSTIKPWRQKGTGRARFGSRYNPIWRGGGIAFGPLGEENYKKKLSKQMKRKALKQALSIAKNDDKLIVVETHMYMDKKTKDFVNFLNKIGANGRILCVVSKKDPSLERAARNVANIDIEGAKSLSVYRILNADTIVITKKSLEVISGWLGDTPTILPKANSGGQG